MPPARREEDGTRVARLGFLVKAAFVFGLGAVAADGVCEGAREILEGFRCTIGAGAGCAGDFGGTCVCAGCAGCAGRAMVATEGFLRN